MKKTVFASAAALLAMSGSAMADLAETKGGIKVKTDDGRFEMNIGGRIHFDAFLYSEDEDAKFGSGPENGSSSLSNRGGTAFRREYLTLTGKLYGWEYKYEHDFAAEGGTINNCPVDVGNTTAVRGAGPDGVLGTGDDVFTVDPSSVNSGSCASSGGAFGASGNREMWVATQVGPGKLTLGQFKPYRGMEELTSSNELTLAERPVTSASGIYAGRQFLMGVGYKGIVADQFGYGVDVMQLGGANVTTEGRTYGGRGYWFPYAADGQTVHVGLSYSVDSEDVGSAAATPSFTYGGRRGAALNFGNAGTKGSSNACSNANVKGCGSQSTFAAELAGSYGPVTLQAEYAKAKLEDAFTKGTKLEDADVDAYYVQASWFVTGEMKPYKKDRGAFGSPKPINSYGAWEAVARYEFIESKDESAANSLCSVSGGTGISGAATADKCEIEQITLGVNWYVNPNVRFLLNYYLPTADLGGTAGKDEPDAAVLRTQLSF